MNFRSKIDTWLAATLLSSALASLVAAYLAASHTPGAGLGLAIALLAIGGGLPLWLLFSTSYKIKGAALHICSGPFRWRIPKSQVTRVTPSRSFVSSPALSLDRLRIEYGRGKVVMVSPRDSADFLKALGETKES